MKRACWIYSIDTKNAWPDLEAIYRDSPWSVTVGDCGRAERETGSFLTIHVPDGAGGMRFRLTVEEAKNLLPAFAPGEVLTLEIRPASKEPVTEVTAADIAQEIRAFLGAEAEVGRGSTARLSAMERLRIFTDRLSGWADRLAPRGRST